MKKAFDSYSQTKSDKPRVRLPRVVLLYHYFYPDDVISARLFSDLAIELTQQGYDVTAMPSIRSCHDEQLTYPKVESWQGVRIRRVWRPAWKQASNRGRLGNAFAVLVGWSWRAIWWSRNGRETVILGTDPILSVLTAIVWRVFRPRARIIHWVHDVYPQAAIADELIRPHSLAARVLNRLLRIAYRRCNVVADLGPCMRAVMSEALGITTSKQVSPTAAKTSTGTILSPSGVQVTLPPWSLVEPNCVPLAKPEVRSDLFGAAMLGLLYSGNLGRGHLFEPFLQLARNFSTEEISLCFAGRGVRFEDLKRSLTSEDKNIRLLGFASESQLEERLAAADVHLVSLKPAWTGSVIPSKFFGSLASGRPVLFAGSSDSSLAIWIREFGVGWVLDDSDFQAVVDAMKEYARDPIARSTMNNHCFEVYQERFSKKVQLSSWVRLLE